MSIRSTLFRMMILAISSLSVGIAFNQWHSGGFAWDKLIRRDHSKTYMRMPLQDASKLQRLSLDEAYTLFKTKAGLFVDARQEAIFKLAHIQGAVSCYYSRAKELPIVKEWEKNKTLITYCGGPRCDQADRLAMQLIEMGFTNVFVFTGGMEEWRTAGYPIEEKKHSTHPE